MSTLETTDAACLQAATGWLELGDWPEAEAELRRISQESQQHPDVLQARWWLSSKKGSWPDCLDLAVTLTQIIPERRFGWIHKALSLHHLGQTLEAREVLIDAQYHFGPNPTMSYFLARYCCCLDRLDEARYWFSQALELLTSTADKCTLKQRALGEPELAPIRDMITWGLRIEKKKSLGITASKPFGLD